MGNINTTLLQMNIFMRRSCLYGILPCHKLEAPYLVGYLGYPLMVERNTMEQVEPTSILRQVPYQNKSLKFKQKDKQQWTYRSEDNCKESDSGKTFSPMLSEPEDLSALLLAIEEHLKKNSFPVCKYFGPLPDVQTVLSALRAAKLEK